MWCFLLWPRAYFFSFRIFIQPCSSKSRNLHRKRVRWQRDDPVPSWSGPPCPGHSGLVAKQCPGTPQCSAVKDTMSKSDPFGCIVYVLQRMWYYFSKCLTAFLKPQFIPDMLEYSHPPYFVSTFSRNVFYFFLLENVLDPYSLLLGGVRVTRFFFISFKWSLLKRARVAAYIFEGSD